MTKEDQDIIYLLAQRLTGAHPEGTFQHGIFIANVEKRMRELKKDNVADYLKFAQSDTEENGHLISALSIHTTSWFRENPHYVILQKIILSFLGTPRPYRIWSGACSTGEEVYSLALLFEEFREHHSTFDYSILGTDIDPVSVKFGQRAIYDKKDLQGPVEFYKKHVLLGSGPTEGHFTFTKELRRHCKFAAHDIRGRLEGTEPFDLIVCRNVLIYFPAQEVERVVQNLISMLRPGGHLILGHSEMIDYNRLGLQLRGNAVYSKKEGATERTAPTQAPPKKTPGKEAGEPIAPAKSAKILRIVPNDFRCDLILIGASTGGPQALAQVLDKMPADCPPIIIVQHIATNFARSFAGNVSEMSGLTLGLALDKTMLHRNHVYVAEGDAHVGIEHSTDGYLLRQYKRPPVNGHRPSVDFLFSSSTEFARNVTAILLSGMGHDGAKGMEILHNHGAYTLAQNEADCVIYGMPKEAIDIHAADFVGSGVQIRERLGHIIQRRPT